MDLTTIVGVVSFKPKVIRSRPFTIAFGVRCKDGSHVKVVGTAKMGVTYLKILEAMEAIIVTGQVKQAEWINRQGVLIREIVLNAKRITLEKGSSSRPSRMDIVHELKWHQPPCDDLFFFPC